MIMTFIIRMHLLFVILLQFRCFQVLRTCVSAYHYLISTPSFERRIRFESTHQRNNLIASSTTSHHHSRWSHFGGTISYRASLKVCSSLNPAKSPDNEKDKIDRRHKAPSTTSESAKDNRKEISKSYKFGVGKNLPVGSTSKNDTEPSDKDKDQVDASALGSLMGNDVGNKARWHIPKPTDKIANNVSNKDTAPIIKNNNRKRVRRMVARSQESSTLRGAIWHEEHYSNDEIIDTTKDRMMQKSRQNDTVPSMTLNEVSDEGMGVLPPKLFYPNIDLSIPLAIYDPKNNTDIVWDLMRWEAFQEAQREPLLVSFLYSSILNHESLESSLAFLLANKLASPAMVSTQVNSIILEALRKDPSIGRAIRADIMAVRDRDPACTCLPDVFLYFKGFHALQTYRVAHAIWKSNKQVLAHYLQSQMSQTFQIDIHPNATLGSGIMLDHGTGIVIGETSHLGNNCSVLHHVTLGGSGKKGVDRHPKVGDGVLLGAGASILGNVKIGDGCQVGAGGLVITDLPPHVVAVGVPVKIIGSFVDVTEQPSIEMNQMMDQRIVGGVETDTFLSDGI